GKTIKAARQAAGVTQEELAEKVDITSRFLMGIENEGRNPSYLVLYKISKLLNIPPENFFNFEDATTENEKEQLIRLLSQCDERDIRVLTAAAKELIESK
ncbi:MAG: helix-turn-helix transcriptional regulator, partial [Christensenellaceae bacterium]